MSNNIVFDPFSPGFTDDPYTLYSSLREHDPVHRSPMGYWVLTRYNDIFSAIKDTRFSNEPSYYALINRRNIDKYLAADIANNIFPFMDPPKHTGRRKLISKAFLSHLRSMPINIRNISDSLLDINLDRGQIDILNEYATPLTVRIIGQLLGTPPDADDKLKAWSVWFFSLFNIISSKEIFDNLNVALTEFRDFMLNILEERRKTPKNDLVTTLLNAEEDGLRLTDDELVYTIMLLFATGTENVDKGIGNCVALLLENPEVYDQVENDLSLIPNVIDEAMRINPPSQFIARVAKEDIVLHGKKIRKNDIVFLVLASANRDHTVFENPDTFNYKRSNFNNLSFGKGRHACIGAPLAKMEMQISLESIFSKLRNPLLASTQLEWQSRVGHRWLKRLPVQFEAVSNQE